MCVRYCGYKFLLWIFLPYIKATSDLTIPQFTTEPPNIVHFYNTTGTVVPCSGKGVPQPLVHWTKQDGSIVQDVTGLRHVRPDGTLVFPPFRSESYRQDVHASMYRCIISNTLGSVASRDVTVRAVMHVTYDIRTYDDFVVRGNTALLKCYIPASVKDFVTVVAWETDDSITIAKGVTEGKYRVTFDGALLINDSNLTDARRRYRCVCRDDLDHETISSDTWGQLIVTEPTSTLSPRITGTGRDVKATVGQYIEIPCIAKGYPVPSYTWYKEDGSRLIPISYDQRFKQMKGSLVIERATIYDSGTYLCIANNSIGENRAQFKVSITERLSVSIYPTMVKAKEGTSQTFNCTTNRRNATYFWRKNLQLLSTSSRVRFTTSGTLRISPIQREDKGIYQCFVYNNEESAQAAALLSLEEDQPEFREVFSEHTYHPGYRISMKCAVTGNPLPQVAWFHYSKLVTEDGGLRIGDFVDSQGILTSFINITSATIENGGMYTCNATNEVGSVSHSARIMIFGPPFVNPMNNITVVAGDNIAINCPYSGYPIKSVVWKKDNYLAADQRAKDFGNGTLFISQHSKSDEGWYHCEVSNKKGETSVGSVYIKVTERPVINPFLFGDDLREGMRTMVVCSVLTGEPPITIEWFKDNHPLSPANWDIQLASLGEFTSSLTIANVTRHHAGNYTCRATSGTARTSYTTYMAVRASPKWMKQPKDLSVIAGHRAVFICQADGIPDPVHRWKFSSGKRIKANTEFKSVVSSSHMYVLENGSLVIADVQKSDEGLYLCEASNGVGSTLSKVVRLTVKVPPYFEQNFEMKTVKEKQDIKLVCVAYGEKPLTISWRRHQRPIDRGITSRYIIHDTILPDGIKSQLQITSAEKSDSGIFTCEAQNQYGKEERSIQITVQAPPDAPYNIQVLQVTSRMITLSWATPLIWNSPLTGYIVIYNNTAKSPDKFETVKIPPTDNKVILTSLTPGTMYLVRIYSENMFGRSEASDDIIATTEEEAPMMPPTDVKGIATASDVIKVTWKPPPVSPHQGEIMGYYVGYKDLSSSDPFVYKTVEIGKDVEGEVSLSNLNRFTKYVITVQAFNSKGAGPSSKEIIIQTLEHDPPKSPTLKVVSRTSSSLELQWDEDIEKYSPVTGYILHHRNDLGDLEETHISQKKTRHTVTNLRCGTSYQFTLTAFNNAGRGEPSDVISARTTGGEPVAPDKSSLLVVNSTFLQVRLSSWNDGGCPILFFVVQYKSQQQKEWILLSNNIVPEQHSVTISDLNSGTWYELLMSAHNDAGSTDAEYKFATLTLTGGTVPPLDVSTSGSLLLLTDPAVLVPIICAIVVVVVITIVVAVVIVLRRKDTPSECRSQAYSGSSGGKGENLSMSSYGKVKRSDQSDDNQREPLYYPTPYATTQLASYAESPNVVTHSNTIRRHGRQRRDHEYDIPHRITQVEDYTSYAKLWTQSRSGQMSRNIESHPGISSNSCLSDNISWSAIHSRNSKMFKPDSYSAVESDIEDLGVLASPPTDSVEELSETECDRHQEVWTRTDFHSRGDQLIRQMAHVY
ncbi:cell adhesion molecule Dscam1-like isoform X1 [Centruroides vittatus]|uniref:cell adhesion molecule Dscam1-like isoform X1 n=1 Tax=Centruroides vittatus TaxID=120091 RepID=UPI003510062F